MQYNQKVCKLSRQLLNGTLLMGFLMSQDTHICKEGTGRNSFCMQIWEVHRQHRRYSLFSLVNFIIFRSQHIKVSKFRRKRTVSSVYAGPDTLKNLQQDQGRLSPTVNIMPYKQRLETTELHLKSTGAAMVCKQYVHYSLLTLNVT